MDIIKLWYHFVATIKIALYKIIYRKRLSFGKKTTFRKGFNILIDKNAKVVLGDNCFFNNGCSINCLNSINIGDGTIFGEGVRIYDHNHKFTDFSCPIKEQGFSKGSISIGRHCWIGSNVVILKGADIGDNCVIGAGCVISGKIESGYIVKNKFEYTMEKIRGGRNNE